MDRANSAPLTPSLRTFQDYLALTKPRLLPLVLVTGVPALVLAGGGLPGPVTTVGVLFGIALAAGAANTLNCFVERDRDRLMERTADRPLPAGQITPTAALVFGLVLALAGTAVLLATGGAWAAGLGVASILYYVFVYTVWIKPRSAWSTIVGGAAGAVSPLIADAAVNGSVGPVGWLLFAIIFFWQPPHVWAIALYRRAEYEQAGFPMLPSVIGDDRTRWRMLWYTIGLVPVTLAPVPFQVLGPVYAFFALGLGAWFVWHAVRVLRERTDVAARRMFRVSLIYLAALFASMLVDAAF